MKPLACAPTLMLALLALPLIAPHPGPGGPAGSIEGSGAKEEVCEDPKLEADGTPPALAFSMKRLEGGEEPLAAYHGQVLLLVNVASKCSFTPQYDGLEALYETYRNEGFAVLGFPSNDFAGQEPGSDEEIASFCRATYSVAFPMFSKIRVKGEGIHPLYRHLTGLPSPIGGPVEWNFQKYLVSRHGEVMARFDPPTLPGATELVSAIEQLLDEEL